MSYPTLGAHMEMLIKFCHYFEQEHDTLGAKLIWSVHTQCVCMCVCVYTVYVCMCMCVCGQENWATIPRNCAKHAYEYVWLVCMFGLCVCLCVCGSVCGSVCVCVCHCIKRHLNFAAATPLSICIREPCVLAGMFFKG